MSAKAPIDPTEAPRWLDRMAEDEEQHGGFPITGSAKSGAWVRAQRTVKAAPRSSAVRVAPTRAADRSARRPRTRRGSKSARSSG